MPVQPKIRLNLVIMQHRENQQIACRPGDFHKRTRETSSNSNSDSGLGFKLNSFLFIYTVLIIPQGLFLAQ